MSGCSTKCALISVYDKRGVLDFARGLHELGIELISTGGTARLLEDNTLPVRRVEDLTGFAEMINGRVKTLHPHVHAAILARREHAEDMAELAKHGLQPIDIVVVNLYPFEKTIADPACTLDRAIEMIDIGGPCMLRAAAKNFRHVIALSAPQHYETCLSLLQTEAGPDDQDRLKWAQEAFRHTAQYDTTISGYLISQRQTKSTTPSEQPLPMQAVWRAKLKSPLRYGENPHQQGALYEPGGDWTGGIAKGSLAKADLLQGEMSFNNYVDTHAGIRLCREVASNFSGQHAVVFVKHNNACGAAVATEPIEAYRRAYLGDSKAAYGGVLVMSCPVDVELASAVMGSFDRWGRSAGAGGFFVEVWACPHFQRPAIAAIREKKNWGKQVRLLALRDMLDPPSQDELILKQVSGGMLVQTADSLTPPQDRWRFPTSRRPTAPELADLRLAMLVCKHTTSNAITLCRSGMVLGNGAGQMSRIMSCRLANWLADQNGHTEQLRGAVAASDGFFPFRDGPELLIESGVRAIIQPGGSKRDAESVAACDEWDVAMVFTGMRHFRH